MGSTSLSFHVDVGMCTILITVPFWHPGYKTNLRLVGRTTMTFDEVLAHVLDLLQRQGRVSYRALKRRFDLDDEYQEDSKGPNSSTPNVWLSTRTAKC